MDIPFTTEQFMEVFRNYNLDIWPLQVVLYGLALAAIFFTIRKEKFSDKLNTVVLSLLWMWMGIIYHLVYFSPINQAAYFFGIFFIIQGLLFAYEGLVKERLNFHYRPNLTGISGAILIIYGLLIYPFIGHLAGHIFPSMPTFGLPCPTTIFTFGLLLWTANGIPRYLLIIPLLWAMIGSNAAFSLGIVEDYGLLVAGIIAAILLLFKKQSRVKIVEIHNK